MFFSAALRDQRESSAKLESEIANSREQSKKAESERKRMEAELEEQRIAIERLTKRMHDMSASHQSQFEEKYAAHSPRNCDLHHDFLCSPQTQAFLS